MRGLLYDQSYVAHFSGHETFPLRQLWLKKAYDALGLANSENSIGVFTNDDSIVTFGVGKNMVASIRHWATACEIIYQSNGCISSTPLGHAIFAKNGFDPYCEHIATTWLVHWKLAGVAKKSTTWFWVFNHVGDQTFDADRLNMDLLGYLKSRGQRISPVSIKRDVEVFLRSYVPKAGGGSIEDIAEPMLGELGLIETGTRGVFEFRRGPKSTLPDGIFLYALLEYWKRVAEGVSTLSFESIAYEPGSPGRVFKLDEDSVADRLIGLETITRGKYVWSDTAGLRQVICLKGPMEPIDVLGMAYE